MSHRGMAAALALALAAGTAHPQIYRWVDEDGRVRYTDTPAPASARGVQKKSLGARAAEPSGPAHTLEEAMKRHPLRLFTSPTCTDACALARAALNRRGLPFVEVQVWDAASNEELKRASGGNAVPTLLVGARAVRGFSEPAFGHALDAAGYPAPGVLPARDQGAPQVPEGYVPPAERSAAPPDDRPR